MAEQRSARSTFASDERLEAEEPASPSKYRSALMAVPGTAGANAHPEIAVHVAESSEPSVSSDFSRYQP
jgi:hypothetical protein